MSYFLTISLKVSTIISPSKIVLNWGKRFILLFVSSLINCVATQLRWKLKKKQLLQKILHHYAFLFTKWAGEKSFFSRIDASIENFRACLQVIVEISFDVFCGSTPTLDPWYFSLDTRRRLSTGTGCLLYCILYFPVSNTSLARCIVVLRTNMEQR